MDSDYACDHTCIEPYVDIIREFFGPLDMRDLLFIDLFDVIRPQSDVLFEH